LLLTLAIIGLLYCLDGSLKSEVDFGQIRGGLSHPLVKLVALGFMWSFLHHFCAGIRFLFLDLGKGINLSSARATAYAVFIVSGLLTLILGVKIW